VKKKEFESEGGAGGTGWPFEVAGDGEGNPERLVVVESPAMVMTAGGFVEAESQASIALGREEDILARLREQGWSEEAIAAFKSGRAVSMEFQKTPFGRLKLNENWRGKDEEKLRDGGDAGEAEG